MMSKGLRRTIFALLCTLFIGCTICSAQTTFQGVIRIDKTVHDWGDVTVKDGPLSCSFTVENISGNPVRIASVASSCGCTGVKWTKEDILPGATGTIEATYSNDEGPYAFDKTLSVTLAGVKRPLILHLRGVVHPKKLPLKETYTVQYGALGLRSDDIKLGNMSQGEVRSSELMVANVSKKEIIVSFADLDPQLSISPAELKIAGNSTAKIQYTITTDRSRWGKNYYKATPVVNGEKQDGTINFWAVTKESFDKWTKTELDNAAKAEYEGSLSFDSVKAGTILDASFKIANKGRSALKIYKVEYDEKVISVKSAPSSVKAGGSASFSFKVDSSNMKADRENLSIITLYTNDPAHALIHLYIDAIIL